jgi:hypothetical protein
VRVLVLAVLVGVVAASPSWGASPPRQRMTTPEATVRLQTKLFIETYEKDVLVRMGGAWFDGDNESGCH